MSRYDGIDYSYAPESYWVDSSIRQSILRNIKGTERRKLVDEALRNGNFDLIEDELIGAEVSYELRNSLSAIHPHLMGGEYLPSYLEGETEIARIELQSTTSDVISIRARGQDGLIHYRIVDEYDGEFVLSSETSQKPFTLEELVYFIENSSLCGLSGSLHLGYNGYNLECMDSRDELRDFTSISSDIYSDLYNHFDRVFDDWVAGLIEC